MKSHKLLRLQMNLKLMLGNYSMGFGNKLLDRLYKIYRWVLIFYYISAIQSIPFVVVSKYECTEIVLKMASLYLHHINAYITARLAEGLYMRRAFDQVLDYETTIYPKESNVLQGIYNKYVKLNFNVAMIAVILPNQYAWMYYYLDVKNSYIEPENPNCAMKKGVVYQMWYPFDIEKHLWLAAFQNISELFIACTHHIFNKTLPTAMACYQLGQFEILHQMLRDLEKDAKKLQKESNIEYDEAVEVLLNNCIRKHQDIINFMDLLNKGIKTIMLIAFFTSSMEMAVFLMQMITAQTFSDALIVAGVSFVIAIQILSFFWLANEVFLQSMRVSEIIYNEINWVDLTIKQQKKLIIMMALSQKSLSFRASMVGEMTLETYKAMIKSCYTVVTFFETAID